MSTLKPEQSVRLWQRVTALYAKALRQEQEMRNTLKAHKLDDPTLPATFQLGCSNGSLMRLLPKAGEVLEQLRTLGLLNEKNEETLFGHLTVPLTGADGNTCGLLGVRFGEHAIEECHVPATVQGIFNRAALKSSQSLLLAGGVLDALYLWQAGFKNVVAFFGPEPTTATLEALFRGNNVCEVCLCCSQDHEVSESLRQRLATQVKSLQLIRWPAGVQGARAFFRNHGAKDFEALLPAAKAQGDALPRAVAHPLKPTPWGFEVGYDERRYELRAIEKPSPSRLKATIRALGEQGRFVIDTIDFYCSRNRRGFLCESARLFHQPLEVIEADVNRITEELERYAQSQLEVRASQAIMVSEGDRLAGVELGRAVNLPGEIVQDMERLGIVGERINILTAYLVMISRKLADPLALLILSGSGAGKSLLQNTLLRLCPEEDLVKLTSLSDRALFYKGEDSLKNKVLALEEMAGAEGAAYAIRNLISAKKLVIETTVKNPVSGQLTTQLNTVNGPTAVFQTTTAPDLDAEMRSRFIVTSIDETPEQTRAILEAQRNSHTLEGLRRQKQCEAIIARHHAFQRLLKPLTVVNPYEPLLGYADDRLNVRRDHPNYLTLILAVTFLHQMQRPVKHDRDLGDYIETTLDDIAFANELATALFGQSLAEVSRPGQQLLTLMLDHVQNQAGQQKTTADKITFSRRELRESFQWSEYQLRTYLHELTELEYVWPLAGRQGQPFRYRLLYDGQGQSGQRFLAGLKSVEQLRREFHQTGSKVSEPTSRAKNPLRGQNGSLEGTSLSAAHEVHPAPRLENSGVPSHTNPASRSLAGSIYAICATPHATAAPYSYSIETSYDG